MKDFELIVIDDDSTDWTYDLCREAQKDLNLIYIALHKRPNEWRDFSSILNLGIRAAKGDFIIGTHPEVMPGFQSLEKMCEEAKFKRYVCAKTYYLTKKDQMRLDDIDWMKSLTEIRKLPGFYDQESAEFRKDPDYTHKGVERAAEWKSWIFGGMDRKTWKLIGGISEHETWGTVDVTFLQRRKLLGIENITLQDDETYCIHQNHDFDTDVPSPRNLNEAITHMAVMTTAEDAIENNLW